MAYNCLISLPLNKEYAKQTVDGLEAFHQMISYQTYFKKPPTPELETPPHDGLAEIKKVKDKLAKDKYKGLYDFSEDLYGIWNDYRDGHTNLLPESLFVFQYSHEVSLVTVADDPTKEPGVWTLKDDRTLGKQVHEINGHPVVDYLSHLANTTGESFGFSDPDTRYNMLMAQFPTVSERENMGYFQYRSQWPGEDSFTIKYADGTEKKYDWLATMKSSLYDEYLTSSEAFAEYFWLTDSEFETMSAALTKSEVSQFETNFNIRNPAGGWEKKKTGKHHKSKSHKSKSHRTSPVGNVRHHKYPPREPPQKRDLASIKKTLKRLRKRDYDDYDEYDEDEDEDEYDEDEDEDEDDYDYETPTYTKSLTHSSYTHADYTHTPTHTSDDYDDYDDDDDYDGGGGDDDDDDDDDDDYEGGTDNSTHIDDGTNNNSTINNGLPEDDPLDPGYPVPFNSTKDGNLKFYSLDGETAVLDVSSFDLEPIEARELIETGLDHVLTTGHKYLIIDLTNNGGGAAWLPFDFARILFPKKYVFESVNMRYTKPALIYLKTQDLGWYWTTEGKDFSSVDDIFGPVSRDGDQFTNVFKYDHIEVVKESAGYGYEPDPNQKQPFPKENVAVLSNGYCGSACFAWYEALHNQGVRSYAFGGRPNSSKYMQASGGIKG